jgi:hypothetical protein
MYVLYIDMNTACVLGKVPKVLQPYTIHRRRVHKAIMVYIDICIGGHRYAYMYIMYVDTYSNIFIHVYMYIYVYIHAYFVRINMCVYIFIHIYIYKYAYIRRGRQSSKSATAARDA